MITSIKLDDTEVRAVIDALPSHIFRATKSSTWHTTQFAQKRMAEGVAEKIGISSYVFRRFRVKSRLAATKGLVWVGANMIKAAYLGDLQQDPFGAWAGDYFFEGSFIAQMKSGHRGIFKRVGEGRLPIQEKGVTIKAPVLEVAQIVAWDARQELLNAFVAKVRELNPHIQ